MKLNLTGGILLLMMGSVAAGPSDDRKLNEPLAAGVMSISIDGSEPRTPLHLRDALRQPFDGVDDPFKPYRLSAEERQRMREQLRRQPTQTDHKRNNP